MTPRPPLTALDLLAWHLRNTRRRYTGLTPAEREAVREAHDRLYNEGGDPAAAAAGLNRRFGLGEPT